MKTREPRRRVIVAARMRLGTAWSDVTIRNMSSRGLMASSADAPMTGTYVEIRRGRHVVIGRTVWRAGRNFGVRTQDRLDIEAITGEAPGRPASGGDRRADPRATPAPRRRRDPEAARRWASAVQYATLAIVAVIAAGYAASHVFASLSRPFAAVQSHLAGGAQ